MPRTTQDPDRKPRTIEGLDGKVRTVPDTMTDAEVMRIEEIIRTLRGFPGGRPKDPPRPPPWVDAVGTAVERAVDATADYWPPGKAVDRAIGMAVDRAIDATVDNWPTAAAVDRAVDATVNYLPEVGAGVGGVLWGVKKARPDIGAGVGAGIGTGASHAINHFRGVGPETLGESLTGISAEALKAAAETRALMKLGKYYRARSAAKQGAEGAILNLDIDFMIAKDHPEEFLEELLRKRPAVGPFLARGWYKVAGVMSHVSPDALRLAVAQAKRLHRNSAIPRQ